MARYTDEQLNMVLDSEYTDPDIGKTTMRQYFGALLKTLFQEGEGFSGKRPFGNSGWENNVVVPMIASGFLDGEIDDGLAQPDSQYEADALLFAAIDKATGNG